MIIKIKRCNYDDYTDDESTFKIYTHLKSLLR